MTLKAVQVRGPFRGPSGYDHHVREFVRELVAAGVEVQLIEFPEWGPARLRPEDQDPLFDSLAEPVDARVNLQFCMPHQLIDHPELPVVNHTMFEATRIPYEWVEVSERCALTAVPTLSSYQAWAESGAPADRLRLCPLGIRSALFGADAAPMPIEFENGRPFASYKHRFLNISAWDYRKNLEGLLKTWLRATSSTDDAALVVKVGCYQPNSRHEVQGLINVVQCMAKRKMSEAAPVRLVFDFFSDEEMPNFYAAATHYISMSHGEGWDLPMMEAIGTGLVPIAPDHSAYGAYIDPATAHVIPSVEHPAPSATKDEDFWTLTGGANWWNPDENAAAEIIRSIIDDGALPAASARDRVLGEFTWKRATLQLIEILEETERLNPI